MRMSVVGMAALAMVWTDGAQGAIRPASTARRVQLIAMGAPAKPAEPAVADARAQQESVADTSSPVAPDFKVHDLSRRWVEFQMARSLAGADASVAPTANEDPFAHVGVADRATLLAIGAVPTVSAIPVPLWMRGGPVFASAAYRYVPGCASAGYRPSGFLASDAEYRRASYYGAMSNIACEYGIPVGLFDAMIIKESRYRPDAFSPKNAFGLTQLMPGTAVALGVNRYSIEDNLRGGAKYLRQQLDRFGHYHLALAAYNAGPGRVRNGQVPQIAETQAYVDNVLQNWSRLSGVYRQPTFVTRVPAGKAAAQRSLGRIAAVSTF